MKTFITTWTIAGLLATSINAAPPIQDVKGSMFIGLVSQSSGTTFMPCRPIGSINVCKDEF